MSLILNIETSTEICSICISDEEKIYALQETVEPYTHAKQITHLIKECVKDAKISLKALDAVAVSQGPGSYTALRIGTSVAKGICYALGKPLIAINTLQALAFATAERENEVALYCPMIDARRMEVYCSLFDFENKAVTKTSAQVIKESSYMNYFASNQKIIFSGNGSEKCKSILHSEYAIFSPVTCSSTHLSKLSQRSFQTKDFCDLAYYAPNYYKSPNITIPKNKKL